MPDTVFAKTLLSWYDKHRRDLPWRKTNDPYKIWLSEVMLQQTRVDTVINYYHTWLRKYPTLFDVATAEPEALLKSWEGLGYYSRCRNFQKASRIVQNEFRGTIPSSWKAFRSLPGVGDYTAAAVLSIAFDKPIPAIDGNVRRITARILALRQPQKQGQAQLINRLQNEISHDRPGHFNQALMDLGNAVCRSNQAHCLECPLTDDCLAFQRGNPESYPAKKRPAKKPHYQIVAGLIWRGDKFLIRKRPEKGLLGGLWEFPGGKIKDGERPETAVTREIREECGLVVKAENPVGTIEHAYSHFSISLTLFHCRLADNREVCSDQPSRWIKPSEVSRYPFPKANHKLFCLLENRQWK